MLPVFAVFFLVTLSVSVSQTKTAADLKISVKAPSGWKLMAQASVPTYSKDTNTFIVTKDSVPSTVKSPAEYVAFVKKLYQQSFKNVVFKDTKAVVANGHNAQLVEYTGEISGMKMRYQVVIIINGSRAFTLTSGGLDDGFDDAKADFKTFIDSVKIEPGA